MIQSTSHTENHGVGQKSTRITYVGGSSGDRLSLHSLQTGKRLNRNTKKSDIRVLSFSSWRTYSIAR